MGLRGRRRSRRRRKRTSHHQQTDCEKRDGSHPNVGIYFCTNLALLTFYFLRFPIPFRRPSPHTLTHPPLRDTHTHTDGGVQQ